MKPAKSLYFNPTIKIYGKYNDGRHDGVPWGIRTTDDLIVINFNRKIIYF